MLTDQYLEIFFRKLYLVLKYYLEELFSCYGIYERKVGYVFLLLISFVIHAIFKQINFN